MSIDSLPKYCQARASCSTKEHIRAINGSVPVEEASHLHARLCGAEAPEKEVAQVLVVSQSPTWPWVLLYSSRKNGEAPGKLFVLTLRLILCHIRKPRCGKKAQHLFFCSGTS